MSALSFTCRAGHVLGFVLALGNVGALGIPDDGTGPPRYVLVVNAVLAGIVFALLVLSWRRDAHGPRRIAAVLLVVMGLGALPGVLVGSVPIPLQVIAGSLILLTIVTIVLLFYPRRAPAMG